MFPILTGFRTLSTGDDAAASGCCGAGSDGAVAAKAHAHHEYKKLPPHLRPAGCNDDCNTCMHKTACHGDVEDLHKAIVPAPAAKAEAAGCCGGSGAASSPAQLLPPPMPLPKKLAT